jgi:hypothetical protein
MTKVKAIRMKCLECSDDRDDIKNCFFVDCPLWVFRTGVREKSEYAAMNVNYPRATAIKKYCLWCMGGSLENVKSCSAQKCLFRGFLGREANQATRSDGMSKIA